MRGKIMSKMYVANASIQRHEFIYRIPEQQKQRRLTIEPMSQVKLADDLNPEQIQSIIEQHEHYGFASTAEIKSGTVKKNFTRLCYSVDQPVSSILIEALSRSNIAVLDATGRALRQQAAIASNEAVVRQLDNQRHEGLEADVGKFEMTVQEEEPRGGYDRPTSDIVAEGFRVNNAETPSRAVKRGRR